MIFSIDSVKAQVKIGEDPRALSPYAVLELDSQELGLLLPRMTTSQRNTAFGIEAPSGLVIFNSDTQALEFYYEVLDASGRKSGEKRWSTINQDLRFYIGSYPSSPTSGSMHWDPINQTLSVYTDANNGWVPMNQNTPTLVGDTSSPTLYLTTSLLGIEGGNQIDLTPVVEDYFQTNRDSLVSPPQQLELLGNTLSISDGNSIKLPLSGGGSGPQNLDLVGNQLSISGGNTITLPSSMTGSTTLSYDTLSATSSRSTIEVNFVDSITMVASGTLSFSTTDSKTLVLTTPYNSGTDSQTLTFNHGSATATQTAIHLENSQPLTLITSGTLTLTNTDSTTLTLTATDNSGTDSQTLTFNHGSATATQTAIHLENSQPLTLITSGTLTLTNTDSTTLTLTATNDSGTDSQTLTFNHGSATATQTAIHLENSQPLTLITSGTLTLTNTDSTTLTLTATDGDKIKDADGDTLIQVEEGGPGTDDDTIRFDANGNQLMTIDENAISIGDPALTTQTRVLRSGISFADINNTNGDADNYINNATFKIQSSNNALHFVVPGVSNNRRAIIQASHASQGFSTSTGPLHLSPYGGGVSIGTLDRTTTLDVNGNARIRTLTTGNTATDKIVVAAANGLLRQVDAAAVAQEPWYTEGTTTGHASNTGNMFFSGNIGVATNTLAAGKVATFAGDVDIQGVLDPTKLIFSGDGSVGSFNPTTDNQYEIEFQEGRDLEIKSNTTNNIMHIESAGNVGIGTNSPTYKLQVGATAGGDASDALINGVRVGRGAADVTENTAVGFEALDNNTSNNFRNTAIGYQSLKNNGLSPFGAPQASDNTAIGYAALRANEQGRNNTAIGAEALAENQYASNNVAIGKGAASANVASSNTAIGANALSDANNSTASHNTAIGSGALFANLTGNDNIGLGVGAGSYREGSPAQPNTAPTKSIFIGSRALAQADNQTNQIVIGHEALGIGSNSVVLGNDDVITTALKGNVGIGNTNPNANAILDLSNTASKVFLLPTVAPGTVSGATDGMLTYDSANNNAYLRANGAWKPLTFNTVTNEMIFNGEDEGSGTYDNYYYVSLVQNGNWKVVRYHKTNPNNEATTDVSNNPGVTVQPTTVAACVALTY